MEKNEKKEKLCGKIKNLSSLIGIYSSVTFDATTNSVK